MKRHLSVTGSGLMLMAAILTGCNDMGGNDKPETGGPVDVTVTATSGGAATRTIYQYYDVESGTHTIHWHTDDKIGVIAYADNYPYGWFGDNREFGLADGAGSASGTFSGSFTDSPAEGEKPEITYKAYYPHRESNSSNAMTMRTNLPSVQKPTATSFDPDADLLISETLKSTGKIGKDEEGNDINFTFMRPISIVKLGFKLDGVTEDIAGEKIEKVVFRILPVRYGNNEEYIMYISGDILVQFDVQRIEFNFNENCYDNVTMDYSGRSYTLGDPGFSAWFTIITPDFPMKEFDVTIETENHTVEKSVRSDEYINFTENTVHRATIDLATGTTITAK